jgi:hypothetical protein
MSRWLTLLFLAAVLATVFASDGSPARNSATSSRFVITQVVTPLFIKQNGAKGTRKIYWAGTPTFPVTLNERGICPESVNCGARDKDGWGTPTAKTVFQTSANPLVTKSYYFCSGGLTSNYVIGVEDWLIDAKGHRTPPVRNFWVCKTH